jgi:hypothetical protein
MSDWKTAVFCPYIIDEEAEKRSRKKNILGNIS